MRLASTKIPLFLVALLLLSCNAVKKVGDGQSLLTDNTIYVDGSKIHKRAVYNQLFQKPNVKLPLIGTPLRLYIYNSAQPNPDSLFYHWLHKKPKREKHMIGFFSRKQTERLGQDYVDWQKFKKHIGEAPVIVDTAKTEKSAKRLKAWYWNRGWFNAKTSYKIHYEPDKRASVDYHVTLHRPYILDSLSARIASKVVDSIYERHKSQSLLKNGRQFESRRFDWERSRLTRIFRNSGLYHFEKENIAFNVDTINTGHKALTKMIIDNREIKKRDTTYTVPFRIHHISDVNIFAHYEDDGKLLPITDSLHYKGYTIYSSGKSDYSPKALTDAVFIKKGAVYSDRGRSLTYDRMNDLGIFKYPDIQYVDDPRDSTNTDLIANIFLRPRKKFGVTYDFDVSRSNIQQFGLKLGGSLLIRNIFHGLETLEIGGQVSIGSSKDAADSKDRFFNISEIGAHISLNFPKIIFPINTDGIIPKTMSPFTTLRAGISTQHNIGLDKQNLTGKYIFRWKPRDQLSLSFNILDLQYVRNLNPNNYFSVYRSSFNRLNEIAQNHVGQIDPDYFDQPNPVLSPNPTLAIPDGVNNFIDDINNGANFGFSPDESEEASRLIERRNRLTENNLIFGSTFHFVKNTKENIYDEEFSQFRFNIGANGNSLAMLARLFNLDKNEDGSYNIAGVRFSQYVKGEADFVKHWDLGQGRVFAVKALAGIAIPYGNSVSIPFVRSFFAGGANDNRGWRPYSLGPGSSGGPNEFNEANMKLGFNAEYRFNLFGNLNSAVFVDVGNIWNVFDNVKDPRSRFTSLSDLKEMAVSSGFGLRYDFGFFVIRVDLGFKTYDPAYDKQTWFEDYNFKHSVLNIGINYPF